MTEVALTESELAGVADQMAAAGETLAGPLQSRLISGGRSNLTFTITDGTNRWVLRTPPRAGRTPSAHDVGREFRVTSALATAGFPVPPPVLLEETEDLLGGPFTVTRFVAGPVIQTAEQLDELDDVRLDQTITALVSTLAQLHSLDHVAIGLERYGRPDAYAERQFKRWSGQWEIVATPDQAEAGAELQRRLAASLPRQAAVGIVHGDYRIDNTIVAPPAPGEPAAIAAVVDWELSTIGDPVADVAMMCAYRQPAFDLVVGQPSAWGSPRIPEVDELAARYEAAGGVELRDWDAHLALSYWKIAVICAGIAHRARSGGQSGAGFSSAADVVPICLEFGLNRLS